jgi:hypothetical protein
LYEDGSIEPRITIINSGQTPAYRFRGIQAFRAKERPLERLARPPENEFLRYGVVGKKYRLTGTKQKLYGLTKREICDLVGRHDYLIVLNGWYKYQDIFGDDHSLDFQMVIGDHGVLSTGKDSEHEWLVFFDDAEGNEAS